MSSARLPGKVLADISGEPMIIRQLERVAMARKVGQIIVATSTDPSDDLLVEKLTRYGVAYFRGNLGNVASRFSDIIQLYRPKTVVRLTADCPLADPEVIDLVVEKHAQAKVDYTSNTVRRTFPRGLDVEVFNSNAFQILVQSGLSPEEEEHVTTGFMRSDRSFLVHSVEQSGDFSSHRWTVDYPEDLEFVREVYNALQDFRGIFTSSQVLDLGLVNPLSSPESATDLDISGPRREG